MFHRKLVSEELAVLDPWIYHRGDGGKGAKKKGQESLSPRSCSQGTCWLLQNTSKGEREQLGALGVDREESGAEG